MLVETENRANSSAYTFFFFFNDWIQCNFKTLIPNPSIVLLYKVAFWHGLEHAAKPDLVRFP